MVGEGDTCTMTGVVKTAGYVDGAAGLAQLNMPHCMAISGSTMYLSDTGNEVIRTINLTDGTVSLLTGVVGSAGAVDRQPGTSTIAQFSYPTGLFVHGTTLYVADAGNHAIRAVDTDTGSVTTVAGVLGAAGAVDGDASTARLNTPFSIVLTVDGLTMYVADFYNHAVRVVDVASGAISTLTGTLGTSGAVDGLPGAALFNNPISIELSEAEDVVYVSDRANSVIRAVNTTNGNTTTYAGVLSDPGTVDGVYGTNRLYSPNAIDRVGDMLYFVSADNLVRVVDMNTQEVYTVVGQPYTAGNADGTAMTALFDHPFGLLASATGDELYVTDYGNNIVRIVKLPSGDDSMEAEGPFGGIQQQCLRSRHEEAFRCSSCMSMGTVKERIFARLRSS
eukprot:scaffold218997_cov46-Prasinocladus_malaysianus.AAC.1